MRQLLNPQRSKLARVERERRRARLNGNRLTAGRVGQAAVARQLDRHVLLRREPRKKVRFVDARTVAGLVAVFDKADFTLPAVGRGKPVPRLFVKVVPVDIRQIKQTAARKSVFLRTVLPLVLQVNEAILRQRNRLKQIAAAEKNGGISKADRRWIDGLAKQYGVKTASASACGSPLQSGHS